jgi:hypothetical protein
MVAALWSNPNYDDKEHTRTKAIRDIEESYADALMSVERALGNAQVAEEDKLDKTNPFFAAAERGLQKIDKHIERVKGRKPQEKSEEDPNKYIRDLDQS